MTAQELDRMMRRVLSDAIELECASSGEQIVSFNPSRRHQQQMQSMLKDKAFILKLQDTVRAAIDEARFAQVVDKMRETKQAKLNTASIPSVVKMASASFGITEAESEGVFQHLIEDADYTLFGLANAVTRYSQDVESYDRATKLEEIGYSVMTMSPELFRRINQVTSMAA